MESEGGQGEEVAFPFNVKTLRDDKVKEPHKGHTGTQIRRGGQTGLQTERLISRQGSEEKRVEGMPKVYIVTDVMVW